MCKDWGLGIGVRTGDWQTQCVDSKHEFGAKRVWSLCYPFALNCMVTSNDPYHLIDNVMCGADGGAGGVMCGAGGVVWC